MGNLLISEFIKDFKSDELVFVDNWFDLDNYENELFRNLLDNYFDNIIFEDRDIVIKDLGEDGFMYKLIDGWGDVLRINNLDFILDEWDISKCFNKYLNFNSNEIYNEVGGWN